MGCSNGSCAINAPSFMPAQSVQPMIEPSGNICGGTSSYVPSGGGCGCGSTGTSGNICGGTSSYVPAGGCGCGGSCGGCGGGTVPSGNICGGTSSFVPGGGGCGSCSACRAEQAAQAATVPSGNICGGTSNFTPAGDSCRCGSCVTKRFHRGTKNQFPGVRRVGTDLGDLRGRNFIPSPPATDKRREMLPNGGGVVQIIPTRTAEPVKAQGAAVPAMIPAATTKPTDLGGGPAPTPTAVMAEGKKEDLGGGPASPAITADTSMALAQNIGAMSLAQNGGKTSAGLWPVYGASGAPMSIIQPMRFANPSKPSFVPGMGMARASGGMYRPSGVDMSFTEEEAAGDDWNQQLLRDTAEPSANGGKGDSGGKDFGTPARREPSTTDYIRSIGGVATAALEGINRTIGQQADIRLRELMAANANAANVRSEANRQLQIELDAGIRQAQIRAQSAGSAQDLARLQAEIAAMRDAATRSATLAVRNEPPSTPLVSPTTRTDEGLSTGAKVGIGVGAVAVLGLGAFLVMRKR